MMKEIWTTINKTISSVTAAKSVEEWMNDQEAHGEIQMNFCHYTQCDLSRYYGYSKAFSTLSESANVNKTPDLQSASYELSIYDCNVRVVLLNNTED
ncbi:hypothetical protein BGZ76_010097 [Entomortierella beljakovae]|nr:hypothetical protein BGZ76_010097 [Entomortierella beljakovae]